MTKSKILVIGGGMVGKALIEALVERECGAVQFDPCADGQLPRVRSYIDTVKNEWRGGSRGKGGKIKWPRR